MDHLQNLDVTFRKWLGADFDIDAIHLTLAVAAVVKLDGDLLWALIVAGPGSGKTEVVTSLAQAGAHIVSTIASPGALLSGTSKGERASDATGGLLREIGDRGVIAFKDFTSILSLPPSSRPEVLGALREIYDGHWVRTIGADGGKKLEWSGRVGVIGAVTTEWDRAHAAVSSMGDRFALLRMQSDPMAIGERALANTGREVQMREELATAVKTVLENLDTDPTELTQGEAKALLRAADLTTWARTAVIRDQSGNVVDAHDREAPTRFAKQLFQIVRGCVAVGLPRGEAMELAIRVAQDSIPPLRLELLRDLAGFPWSYVATVRKRLQRVHNTVDRELKALQMLRLVQIDETENRWRYALSKGVDVAVVETFPGMYRDTRTESESFTGMYEDSQAEPDSPKGRGGTYKPGNAAEPEVTTFQPDAHAPEALVPDPALFDMGDPGSPPGPLGFRPEDEEDYLSSVAYGGPSEGSSSPTSNLVRKAPQARRLCPCGNELLLDRPGRDRCARCEKTTV